MKAIIMKKVKRILALLLAAAALVSLMTVIAYAANTMDSEFLIGVAGHGNYIELPARQKENSTAVYFYTKTASGVNNLQRSNTFHVTVWGYSNETLTNSANFTIVDGRIVPYVTCRVGTKYSISTTAYHAGYPYVALKIDNGNPDITNTTVVSGVWSPDSTKEYTPAT